MRIFFIVYEQNHRLNSSLKIPRGVFHGIKQTAKRLGYSSKPVCPPCRLTQNIMEYLWFRHTQLGLNIS